MHSLIFGIFLTFLPLMVAGLLLRLTVEHFKKKSDKRAKKTQAKSKSGRRGPPPVPMSEKNGAPDFSIHNLQSMDWLVFEQLACLLLNLRRWKLGRTVKQAGSGADGGIDLIGTDDHGAGVEVQCKAWSQPVGVKVLRELIGAIKGGRPVLVTSNRLTSDAREYANGRNIRIIEGVDMVGMYNAMSALGKAQLNKLLLSPDLFTPSCPHCEIKMVERRVNTKFWGCPNFPRWRQKLNKPSH